MLLSKQIIRSRPISWGVMLLLCLGLASQCDIPGPPIPAPLTGPAVRIAILAPATGEMAVFGRMMRNGSLMVFDEWNAHGGLLGHRIEGTIYNSDCEFETGQQAAQQAVAAGFKFIIGPLCSEAAVGAALVAEAEKVLMIAPTATHPLVTVNGQGQTRSTVFRASYATPLQGQAMARFAYDTLKVHQAALFFDPTDDYATLLAETFTQQFVEQGQGQIVYRATYTSAGTDFTESLLAAIDSGAAVIYLPAPPSIVNQIAHRLRELELANILLGSDSWESETLDLAATDGSYFTVHFSPADDRSIVQSWTGHYRSIFALEPNTLAALSYDAATILTTAIRQAGTFEVMTVTAMIEQNRYQGVTGQMTFDDRHNPIKPVPILHIKDGQRLFSTLIFP